MSPDAGLLRAQGSVWFSVVRSQMGQRPRSTLLLHGLHLEPRVSEMGNAANQQSSLVRLACIQLRLGLPRLVA